MVNLCIIDARNFFDEYLTKEALNNISKFRKTKYDAFRNDEAKRLCLAASVAVDKCLTKYGLREKDMEYELGKAGKPYFKNHKEIFFNISHSKNLAMVAFSKKEVGCDIQVVKNSSEELYNIVLSNDEKNYLFSINDGVKRNAEFYKLWAIKEAKLKYEGTGLRDSLIDVQDNNAYVKELILKDANELYYISVNTGCNEEINIIYENVKETLIN